MGKMEKSKGKKQAVGVARLTSSVEATIGDPRFTQLHSDPRFQRLPKNKAKVSIDSRFTRMFSDKGFNDPTRNIRGINSKNRSQGDLLRRYYKVHEEEDEEGLDGSTHVDKFPGRKRTLTKGQVKQVLDATQNVEIDESVYLKKDDQVDNSESRKPEGKKGKARDEVDVTRRPETNRANSEEQVAESDEEIDGSLEKQKAGVGQILGKKECEQFEDGSDLEGLEEEEEDEEEEDVSSSPSSSSSSSSSESGSDVDEEGPEAEEKVPTTNEETRRLAVIHMDWEHIQAVHLLVLMRSFLPKGGRVHSVTIYPSQFGIEQMKEENLHGPKGIFKDEEEEDEEGTDPEKLRQYEKAKLRYYYGVVECDSATTAAHLYNNCDGLEFERTSNLLDLRYIPDDMEFKCAPKDFATEVSGDYKPIEFETRALQHSNVKLTWDDDEPVRLKALRRNFNRNELQEMDFQAFVASTSESESDVGENVRIPDMDESGDPKENDNKEEVRSRYLSLLAGAKEYEEVRGKKLDKEGNIEIKFHTGLDELSKKLLMKSKTDKTDETVWQAYLRKKKEKKNTQKYKKTANDSDESGEDEEIDIHANYEGNPFFSHDKEDPFDDLFFNQSDQEDGPIKSRNNKNGKEGKEKHLKNSNREEERKKKRADAAREMEEVARKRAELELLVLDDNMVQDREELKKVSVLGNPWKKEKLKQRKGRKAKGEEMQEKVVSSANYNDPRFASLFTSHHFAIDPTDPHFKKTASHLETIAEMQRQRFHSSAMAEEPRGSGGNQDGDQARDQKRKAELSSLVRSVKSKLQSKQNSSKTFRVD